MVVMKKLQNTYFLLLLTLVVSIGYVAHNVTSDSGIQAVGILDIESDAMSKPDTTHSAMILAGNTACNPRVTVCEE